MTALLDKVRQACYVSDRIMVMCQGQLVEQGPLEQVLAPQHGYAKRLVADVPLLCGKRAFHQWATVES